MATGVADAGEGTAPQVGEAAQATAGDDGEPRDPQLDAYDKQRAIAHEKGDFASWTALITIAERLNDPTKLGETYDGFLAAFPLCYGYWQKFADAEARFRGAEAAQAVYERGVAAIPNSIDLWLHYCQFKQSIHPPPDDVRSLYERAIEAVGSDYSCHPVWEKYIAFETALGAHQRAAALYGRALQSPLKGLDALLAQFKEFVQGRALHELATKEETAALRPSVQAQAEKDAAEGVKRSAEAAAAYIERIEAGDAEAARAAEAHAAAVQALQTATQASQATAAAAQQAAAGAAHPGSPQDAIAAAREAANAAATAAAEVGSKASQEATAKAAADAAAAAAAELRANAPPGTDALMRGEALPQPAPQIHITDDMLKAAWAAMREQVAARSKEGVAVIKPFESGIRRPYFHVKELDSAQLVVWSRYLDFAERSGAREQVVKLYERCLVACAGYPEFWERYIRYLAAGNDTAAALGALQRATQVHCRAKPAMHLFAARFQEQHGDVAAARASLELVTDTLAPGDIRATVQRANFERRQGDLQTAEKLMRAAHAKAGPDDIVDITKQAAAFFQLYKGPAGVSTARDLYEAALKLLPSSKTLWESAIDFDAGAPGGDSAQRVLSLYERATAPAHSATDGAASGGGTTVAAPVGGGAAANGPTPLPNGTAAATVTSEDVTSAMKLAVGLSDSEREQLSLACLAWADAAGDASAVATAAAMHCKRFPLPVKTMEQGSRKRGAAGAAGTGPAAKKPAGDAAAAAAAAPVSGAPTTPPASAAYPAGYYQYPQGYYGQSGYYQYPQQSYYGQYQYPAAAAAGQYSYPAAPYTAT